MEFPHDRLTVYRKSLIFVAWSQPVVEQLPQGVSARNQLDRASTSIPLNIAEGNVKTSLRDRGRYWETALGSAVECAAILDILVARGIRCSGDVRQGKVMLDEIVRMLAGLLRGLERSWTAE